MDDLAAGQLESWPQAPIVSAFYNLVLGRGLGRRPLFMGTQAGEEGEPCNWDSGQDSWETAKAQCLLPWEHPAVA